MGETASIGRAGNLLRQLPLLRQIASLRMQCAQAKNLIALLVGDDICDPDRPGVERHLSECGSCKTYHDQLAGTQQQLCSLASCTETESPGIWKDLQPQIRLASDNKSTKRSNRWAVALSVAAMVMAMFVISKDLVTTQFDDGVSNGSGVQATWPQQQPGPEVDRESERDRTRDNLELNEIR